MLPRQSTMSKDPILQDDIDRNLKLRDGASRILSVAANTLQRLDAAKTILVSNARLVVSMQKLQMEKNKEANLSSSSEDSLGVFSKRFCSGKATLCLSEIRIPLLWKDASLTPNASVMLNRLLDPSYNWNATGYSSSTLTRQQRPLSAVLSMATTGSLGGVDIPSEACSAFCMVRVGDQIRETRLLCDIHPGFSDLEFDDVLTFEGVQPDFECTIEVYGYQQSSGATGPGGVFARRRSHLDASHHHNRNSVFLGTLTPEYVKDSKTGQRVSVTSASAANDCVFSLVGYYTARLADLGASVQAHQLELTSAQNHNSSTHLFFNSEVVQESPEGVNASLLAAASAFPTPEDALPLFGPICFRLTAQPDSVRKPLRSGLLWIREPNTQAFAHLYSCELRNQWLYARLVKPDDRTTDLTEKTTQVVVCRRRGGVASVGKCDLAVKIDPETKFLDDAPVPRDLPFLITCLTEEEKRRLHPEGTDASASVDSPETVETAEGDSAPPQKYLEQRRMPTLRLASRRREDESPEMVESSEKTEEEREEHQIIFELAVFDPETLEENEKVVDDHPLADWLTAMREHVEEQEKWGVKSFDNEVSIPEATSLTKHGTIIRASTIPEITMGDLPPRVPSDQGKPVTAF